jgi:hypothetical protein
MKASVPRSQIISRGWDVSLTSSNDDAIGWTDDERIDVAAAVAGAIAGYRSFRIAAGLRQNPATVRHVLSAGVPFLLEHRSREVRTIRESDPNGTSRRKITAVRRDNLIS